MYHARRYRVSEHGSGASRTARDLLHGDVDRGPASGSCPLPELEAVPLRALLRPMAQDALPFQLPMRCPIRVAETRASLNVTSRPGHQVR